MHNLGRIQAKSIIFINSWLNLAIDYRFKGKILPAKKDSDQCLPRPTSPNHTTCQSQF